VVSLVYFVVSLVYFSNFGLMCQIKSGNTGKLFQTSSVCCDDTRSARFLPRQQRHFKTFAPIFWVKYFISTLSTTSRTLYVTKITHVWSMYHCSKQIWTQCFPCVVNYYSKLLKSLSRKLLQFSESHPWNLFVFLYLVKKTQTVKLYILSFPKILSSNLLIPVAIVFFC
jgi:hypothetical protein